MFTQENKTQNFLKNLAFQKCDLVRKKIYSLNNTCQLYFLHLFV